MKRKRKKSGGKKRYTYIYKKKAILDLSESRKSKAGATAEVSKVIV